MACIQSFLVYSRSVYPFEAESTDLDVNSGAMGHEIILRVICAVGRQLLAQSGLAYFGLAHNGHLRIRNKFTKDTSIFFLNINLPWLVKYLEFRAI